MSNAILSNVYNHYVTTYAPKNTSRFDTHKRSELKNIYNSIVKLNKESPWYLDTKNKDVQQYAVNLKEGARQLRNTIASLGGLELENTLDKRAAYSSDTDVVTATYVGDTNDHTPAPTLELSVQNLATSQENMGTYLPAEKIDLPADTYSFDVSINDLNYEFQFNINEGDTNRDVQERLVRLINNADIGIQAKLSEGDARSSIRLTSVATGLAEGKTEIFSITDDNTSKASGTVEYFGLSYISRQASNSSFLLNGEERQTASNTFTVGQMYELELKGVTEPDTTVTIGLKTDVESLTDNVNTLIGSYNSFIQTADNYAQDQPLNSRLSREMKRIVSAYQTEMNNMGIHLQSDNTLSVDDEVLKESASASDGSFSYSSLKDFAHSLVQKTSQISLNPMNYVNRTLVAYKNPGHTYVSPYTTSAYSGMMFNYYC